MTTVLIEMWQDRQIRRTEWTPLHLLEDWIRHIDLLGIEEIVLLANDVTEHPDFWELLEFCTDNTEIDTIICFSSGQTVSNEDIRDISMSDESVEWVLPIDWKNPFRPGDWYGGQNYNQDTEMMLQSVRGVQVWQTFSSQNVQDMARMVQNCRQYGIEWRGHIGEEEPDEQIMEMVQEFGFNVLEKENWFFGHIHGEVPSNEFFQQKIWKENKDHEGSFLVTGFGRVKSLNTSETYVLKLLSRRDLRLLTSDSEGGSPTNSDTTTHISRL